MQIGTTRTQDELLFIWLTSGRRIDHTTRSEFRRKHADERRDIFKQMIKLAINLKITTYEMFRQDGIYDAASDSFFCPASKTLLHRISDSR